MVYLGIFIFFLAVLLNDVKISSTAFINSLNYQNTFDQKNFLPLLTVAGTVFAYFSIIILSFGDFSRYVKNENELKKGNLSLLLNLIIFSFFSLFIVIGADTILKQDPENLSIILTNPTDIIGKFNNLLITNLALIFIIIASASTNLIANFIPSQYALINFIPSSISLKRASFIIGFLGFFIGVFWLTLLSQIGILSIIDTLGAFFGPLFGLMISDFYFIQKSKLNNKDIYSLDKEGVYYYSAGWHLKGVYSLILGFIFAASTIWNSNLMFLQSYSWIIGALVTAIVYYLLAKD
jgi:NCS1 family nucleobase:cation symporter-1